MARLKPLLFVVGLSLVSAVTLRLLLGRMAASMQPQVAIPVAVDSAEVSRRLVGCGQLNFVFDSLGYRTAQWPIEVDSALAAARGAAVIVAQGGQLVAVGEAADRSVVGDYLIRRDTAFLTLQGRGAGLRARLVGIGDSLGGRLERRSPAGAVVGRLFLAAPPAGLSGCGSS